MKHLLISSLLFFINIDLYAQKNNYLFNEFGISINQTNFSDEKKEGYKEIDNKLGFGFGTYSTDRTNKRMNIRIGLEFNQIRYFYKYYNPKSWTKTPTDFSYTRSFLSMPVGIRYNIGKFFKFFFETGLSAELAVLGNKYKKANSGNYPRLLSDVCFYSGLGIRKPIKKNEIVLKFDSKGFITNTLLNDNNLKIYSRLVVSYGIN